MSKINIKKKPFDKNLQKNDITSILAMLIDEQNFKKFTEGNRRNLQSNSIKFHYIFLP